jgi:protein-S-isoprenylcysteine O-methyltransferase Ste14
MPKLTIFLWLLFPAVSLGLRIWIQLRTTGRTGFVLSRRTSGPLQLFASGLFLSSVAVGIASPVLAALFPVQPWAAWDAPLWFAAIGGMLYVAGLTLAFTSQLTLGRSWRIGVDDGERTELVMRGAFRVVRNPVFSALELTAISLAMLCSTPLAWFACAVQLFALEIQVRAVEEPYLARVHGDAYRAYVARVGRFVPLIGLRPSLIRWRQPATSPLR